MTGPARPPHAEIIEVAPRDGLQNEKHAVSTEDKVRLIRRLIAAGARRIEIVSFVRADRVPQMADAEAVLAGLGPQPGVQLAGLVLNARGAERAARTLMLDELNYVVPMSDAFGLANQGRTTADALKELPLVLDLAHSAGLRLSVTLAVAFGCPYTGEVPVAHLERAAREVTEAQVDELILADTIGCAVPADVTARIRAVRAIPEVPPLRTHFHQTRLTALGNVHAALLEGVTRHDASAAGIGGCPYAPGAAGNVASEDLAWMLDRSGYRSGIDVGQVADAGRWICGVLEVPTRSGIATADVFPRPAALK